MEPEKQPYEIVPDETQEKTEDSPVIRLEKDTPEPRNFPSQQEKKGIPGARLQPSPRVEQAPPVPFVERQAFNPGGVEKIWGSEHETQKGLPWISISVISFFVVALIIGGLVFTYRSDKKDSPIARMNNQAQAEAADGVTSEAEAQQMIKKMETAVRRYCAATTVQERLKYSRRPEQVKPLMEAYYPDGKVPPIKTRNIQFDPLTMDNRGDFWFSSVETGAGDTRNFIVELPEKGDARIDWEVDVLYQPYDWETFVKEAPNGESHDFRVHVVPGVLYSHEFSDENKWRCYVLSAPNSEAPIFGYCELDGPVDQKLVDLIRRNNGSSVPVILKLKRPAGIISPQGAIIESFVSESWIYMDTAHPGS